MKLGFLSTMGLMTHIQLSPILFYYITSTEKANEYVQEIAQS